MSKRPQGDSVPERVAGGFSMVEMLIVFAVLAAIAAMAVPTIEQTLRSLRITGDGRTIEDQIALAKMRAAADFTQARFHADLANNSFEIEVCQGKVLPGSCASWTVEGGVQSLSQGVALGLGALGAPPPNTQAVIGQAPACLDSSNASVPNTACVVFNSRGIPVDANGVPTGNDAIYVTDGNAVFGATVSATGLIRLWRSGAQSPGWAQQ
jgi:Tfp pilus assembly protein FimT